MQHCIEVDITWKVQQKIEVIRSFCSDSVGELNPSEKSEGREWLRYAEIGVTYADRSQQGFWTIADESSAHLCSFLSPI
jgi:hypothetical protein